VTPVARVALGIVLVAGAGPAGFLLYRVVFGGRLPAQVQPLQPAAQPASPAAPAPRAPVPERLPTLTMHDAGGTAHTFAEWRGHPLIVNFWATWCEPCRREIPLLKSLRARAGGVRVVGIAVDFKAAVVRYAADHGIDYPVLVGEDDGLKLMQAFGMDAVLPFSVFADAEGRIVTVKVGELHADEADLILGRVADIESGRLALPAAQERIAAGMKDLAIEHAKDKAKTPG